MNRMPVWTRSILAILALAISLWAQAQPGTPAKKTATKPVAKKTSTVKKPIAKPGTKTTAKPVAKKPTVPARIPGVRVKITTEFGDMVLRLYDKTPQHRDNFVKLIKQKFYDSLLFHRVIPDFMIQGGDPNSKNAVPGGMLGMGDVGYLVPAEFDSSLYHKKGALAAARTDNPEKASSGCQFYIVQGKTYSDAELNMLEARTGRKIPAAQRMTYKMVGGTPFLDMNYTVFGEVESGLDVIAKIATQARNQFDRPEKDSRMFIEIIEEPNTEKPAH